MIALALVAIAVSACAEVSTRTSSIGRSPSPSPSEPPASARLRKPAPPQSVRLGDIPESGFAISDDRYAWLVDLGGRVVKRLPRFTVAGNPGNDGVWLQRARTYYRLEAQGLEPVRARSARDRIYVEDEPDLPVPPGGHYKGRPAGHWRYAVPGPGGAQLAQWSGECESPAAFWLSPDRDPVLVTGESKVGEGPESIALGWGSDGVAYVFLGEGLCGPRGDPPGIYAFTSPGMGRLLYETPRHASVEMWSDL